jgi:hypothetical protein
MSYSGQTEGLRNNEDSVCAKVRIFSPPATVIVTGHSGGYSLRSTGHQPPTPVPVTELDFSENIAFFVFYRIYGF